MNSLFLLPILAGIYGGFGGTLLSDCFVGNYKRYGRYEKYGSDE